MIVADGEITATELSLLQNVTTKYQIAPVDVKEWCNCLLSLAKDDLNFTAALREVCEKYPSFEHAESTRQTISSDILSFLEENPGSVSSKVCVELGLTLKRTDHILSYHLRSEGLVIRDKSNRWYLTEPTSEIPAANLFGEVMDDVEIEETGIEKNVKVVVQERYLESFAPFTTSKKGFTYHIVINKNHPAAELLGGVGTAMESTSQSEKGYKLVLFLLLAWAEYEQHIPEGRKGDQALVNERWGAELKSILRRVGE